MIGFGIPHTRGDEPWIRSLRDQCKARIPHTRGDEPPLTTGKPNLNRRIPHTRGDEPKFAPPPPPLALVFPTHVGMNRKTK